mgnify:CR=1 FL=1
MAPILNDLLQIFEHSADPASAQVQVYSVLNLHREQLAATMLELRRLLKSQRAAAGGSGPKVKKVETVFKKRVQQVVKQRFDCADDAVHAQAQSDETPSD